MLQTSFIKRASVRARGGWVPACAGMVMVAASPRTTISNVDASWGFHQAGEGSCAWRVWVPACAGMAMAGGESAQDDFKC
jgi:hypothetical protein